MNGLGNDFIVIDQRKEEFDLTKEQIQQICNRDKGIGCDQLIYIRNSLPKIPYIKFFNSNGGEVSACGNGSRCVANYIMTNENEKISNIILQTQERQIKCWQMENSFVKIDMGWPKLQWDQIPLQKDVQNSNIQFTIAEDTLKNPFFVNVGNPHVIFFSEDIDKYSVDTFGPLVETDKLFPEAVNVSFAKVLSDQNIKLTVWERGAGRTKACGTAACATVIAAVELGLTTNDVTVTQPGGDLYIHYEKQQNVLMKGPTQVDYIDKFQF